MEHSTDTRRPQAVILIGIPAAGKSTFCARFFGEAQEYVRINRDTLGSQEKVSSLLWQCLTARRSFVADNTQVQRAERARLIALAAAAGYEVCGYYLPARIDDCLRRNAQRSGSARVPDAAVRSMAARLEQPSYAEGFDRLYCVTWAEDGGCVLSPWEAESPAPAETMAALARRMRCCEPDAWTRETGREAAALLLRLDGRSFSKLTNRLFEKPFDDRFRTMMEQTVHHLMQCGFRVVSAYHQSDEITLVLDEGQEYGRRPAKLLSLAAGEASAAFSVALGQPAAFDCRLHLAASGAALRDYFRWRASDAYRNAFNAYCYWTLRGDGLSPAAAETRLQSLSRSEKTEMLALHGIDFASVPAWQKYGTFYYGVEQEHRGIDPRTGEPITYRRRSIVSEAFLPRL